jgi:deoxyadenosine/deoxycytidine kinase
MGKMKELVMETEFPITTVINIIGPPCAGKSTLAAELYAKMKRQHMDVEMVREVAKEWAIDGRKIGPFDQLAILGEQIKRESSLYGKVKYIVTDSPILIGSFYFDYNHDQSFMNKTVQDYYKYAEESGIKFLNYMLPARSIYQSAGRFESKEEADAIDTMLWLYMAEQKYEFENCDFLSYEDTLNLILGDLK